MAEGPEKKPSSFVPDTIEDSLQPAGGRNLETYEKILGFSQEDLRDKKILDLGAGPELKFAKGVENLDIGASVTSLSPDFVQERHRKKAQESYPEGKTAAAVGQKLPFADESFDMAVALDVFEHLTPEAFSGVISETARVLKRRGKAVFGPFLTMPEGATKFDRIKGDKALLARLQKYNVEVSLADIPENVLSRETVEDEIDGETYSLLNYNIVLNKAE